MFSRAQFDYFCNLLRQFTGLKTFSARATCPLTSEIAKITSIDTLIIDGPINFSLDRQDLKSL